MPFDKLRIENNDLIIPTYDYDEDNPNKNYGHDPELRDYREYSSYRWRYGFCLFKNNYKRLFYRIKNIAEVAILCHYDIRLLSRTTVETVCLLLCQSLQVFRREIFMLMTEDVFCSGIILGLYDV